MAKPDRETRLVVLNYLSTHFFDETDYQACRRARTARRCSTAARRATRSARAPQRLDRDGWKDVLHYMVEEQGMSEPEAGEQTILIQSRTSQALGSRRPSGGAR